MAKRYPELGPFDTVIHEVSKREARYIYPHEGAMWEHLNDIAQHTKGDCFVREVQDAYVVARHDSPMRADSSDARDMLAYAFDEGPRIYKDLPMPNPTKKPAPTPPLAKARKTLLLLK